MFLIDLKHLEPYPKVYKFITEKSSIDGILSFDDFKKTYPIPVRSLYDKSKQPEFTVSEFCVFFDLKKHIKFLMSQFEFSYQLQRRNYRIMRIAVENNRIEIFNLLYDFQPDKIGEMISPYNYILFRIAIRNHHTNMLKRLLELSGDNIAHMIAAHRYEALDMAIESQFEDIIFLLLSYPFVFKYVANQQKYEGLLNLFMDHISSTLDNQKKQFFDIPHHLDLAIEILKYLITQPQNNKLVSNRIQQLMSYDSVRQLIQTSNESP